MTATAATPQPSTAELLDLALTPIAPELELVTQRILASLEDPVAKSVAYLITAGGKRLRPALVLLAGGAGPAPDQAGLIEAAAAVELIHTATLIHDDIIDASATRRSQPTFHYRWGTERAVLMGDYLYATAFTMIAGLNTPEVMRVMARVCQDLSRGELREVDARFQLHLTEADYLSIIQDKTASLIEGCCRAGALLGGCDAATVDRWGAFGRRFGLAFQIIDDCLDVTGNAEELGKSVQADLDKGVVSLPVIYLAEQLSPEQRARLFGRPSGRALTPAAMKRVLAAAVREGAVARAEARARALAEQAREALQGVPSNGLGEAVQALAAYATSRRS